MVLRQLSKEQAKDEVKKLVKEFSAYTKEEQESKSENQIKSEFIDQLFEVLGWDMRKDAEREEKILKGRADYILKLGNQKVLVIEAKKTNVKLTEEEGRQAVSYAYHNKIKFSVLTNFKQIRIYHALSNIKNIDRNLLQDSKGYLWINYEDFDSQFDRLWILSKESFEKGEINKLLSAKDERQAKTVDESLLGDLLKIREWLSKEIKSKKNYLEKEKIDEIVQILIDRLIFIRSVEDRGLEPKDFLLNLDDDVRNQKVNYQLFPYIKEKFKEFNKRYDSKLFEEGLLDKEGAFSDEVLHKVIKGLYFGTEDISRERYMFDQIPCDLLGSIYEQYLGHILKGTEKRIKLESGHGKRKSMGIYYTPSYIVDYIVKNTVGEYLKNKTVDEIMLVKILDPACGSGSFLVRAFEEVCNIIEDKLKNGKFSVERAAFKDYSNRLALHQKITILTNCIYGVDLDEKAVELARLNLLLKLLENEGHETKKLLLPHLENNIKCGNSLIDDAKVSDKAFNWKAQFANVFNDGGFDVVIGNPPYGAEVSEDEIKYLNEHFKTAKIRNYDSYIFFIENSLKLLKERGFFGFIIPDTFLRKSDMVILREIIFTNFLIKNISEVGAVFGEAKVTENVIFTFEKNPDKDKISKNYFVHNTLSKDRPMTERLNLISKSEWDFQGSLSQKALLEATEMKLGKFSNSGLIKVISKIEIFNRIGDIKEILISRGSEGGKNLIENKQVNSSYKPIVIPDDINKYFLKFNNRYFRIHDTNFKKYEKEKILIIRIRNTRLKERIIAAYDDSGLFALKTLQIINLVDNSKLNLKLLLALLNSKLINFYAHHFLSDDINKKYIESLRLPINISNFVKNKLINLVEKILSLQQKYHSPGLSGNEKERLGQQIKNVDYEIDQEVYKLYGITEEEKKMIEDSLK